MSFYNKSPFKPMPIMLIQGTPSYVFGSFNDKTGPTQGFVVSVQSNGSTTGTILFQITSGNVPVAGALITVVGTSNAGGNFNVTNATITNVATTEQGLCTVSYAITSSAGPTTQTPDYGQVIIPQIEIGDQISVFGTTSASASVPVAGVVGATTIGRSLSATVTLPPNSAANPSTLTGVTVVIQGANVDLDSEYNTIGTVATAVAAGSTTDWQSGQGTNATGGLSQGNVDLLSFRFYRLQATVGTGSGAIVGTIMA
jgi:hypothetical protein